MNVQERLGELLVVGFEGHEMTSELAVHIRELRPAGLIFFKPTLALFIQREKYLLRISSNNQHSVMLTANPPRDVSLYFWDISKPVCFIAAIQLSSGIK